MKLTRSPLDSMLPSEKADRRETNSYGQIVKSSSIIGGSQVITLLIALARSKLIAVLIGPSGMGMLSIYQSITGVVSTIAGLGINTTGVREISQYHGKGDPVRIAKTVRILRRVCWFTGIAGMLLMAVLAPWISAVTFGSQDHAWLIAALSVTILLGNISAGQTALIQGTRRIGDIARISVWSALLGTICSAALISLLGVEGVIPSLITLALVTVCISTWYSHRVPLHYEPLSWGETWGGFKDLFHLGLALVISGLLITGVAYVTRQMIQTRYGLTGVGIFTAAFALSGMLVNFIIVAMGSDFLPRLSAVSTDNERINQLINEQTEIGLLIAFPGLLATLLFAPFVVLVFYTTEFSQASVLLKWFVFGCIGRVVSWPMSYGLQIKKHTRIYLLTEIVFNLVHVIFVWVGLNYFGITGPAIAFALVYLLYTAGLWMLTRFTIQFKPSKEVITLLSFMLFTSFTLVGSSLLLPDTGFLILGCTIVAIVSAWCLKQIALRMGTQTCISGVLMSVFPKQVPNSKK